MKPIDYRNETFADIRARIGALQERIYAGFVKYGPCTTRELADLISEPHKRIDLLTVRPRTTELFQLGYVELAYPDLPSREGVYQAVPVALVEVRFDRLKAEAMQEQLPLNL
jgi:hypothetical protein